MTFGCLNIGKSNALLYPEHMHGERRRAPALKPGLQVDKKKGFCARICKSARFTRVFEFRAFEGDRLFWLLRSVGGERPGGARKLMGCCGSPLFPRHGWHRRFHGTVSFYDG